MTTEEAIKLIEDIGESGAVPHAHFVVNWRGDCRCSNCGEMTDYTNKFCGFCGARFNEPEQREE